MRYKSCLYKTQYNTLVRSGCNPTLKDLRDLYGTSRWCVPFLIHQRSAHTKHKPNTCSPNAIPFWISVFQTPLISLFDPFLFENTLYFFLLFTLLLYSHHRSSSFDARQRCFDSSYFQPKEQMFSSLRGFFVSFHFSRLMVPS